MGCCFSCSTAPSNNFPEKAAPVLLPPDSVATVVQTAVAQIAPFEYLIQASGKIKSAHEQIIHTALGGKLITCHAATGKTFGAGALIAQLETTAIEYRLRKAELSRFNSEKEYQSQLLGYEGLLKGKPEAEAAPIRKKLQISTGLLLVEQDIKEANLELEKATIRAPFTGILSDVRVENGEEIRPGQELFRIYDPGNLLLEIKVLEADVLLLQRGTVASIAPVASPGKKYKATVQEVNPYIDENGMALVRLRLIATDALFPGMNCTAVIAVPSKQSLMIPREGVVMRSNRSVVFTIAGGKAQWNYVTPGKTNGKMVEILEGISAGQKVITSNNLQLADDAPVTESTN